MINELLSRQQNLEATRAELTTKLASTRSALDDLTEPRNTDELLDHEVRAAALTAAIARVDTALETVDRQLSTAQAAQRRAEVLNSIGDAAEAAQEATAEEGRRYDTLFIELGAVFTKIAAARNEGAESRERLRALIRMHAPAHPALFYLGPTTTKQEAAAVQLDAELRQFGVDVSVALDSYAELPFGALLIPLLESHQRDNSRKLLEVV